jgi:hypothetical protein
MADSRSYQSRTTSALAAESAAERLRRNGISPALATSREARGAVPAPALVQGHVEPETPPATLRGAVKVSDFPARSPYPFREIAADGGVWKLDPAAYTRDGKTPQAASLRTAASKYGTEHGMKAKTVIEDGFVYVQFKAGGE